MMSCAFLPLPIHFSSSPLLSSSPPPSVHSHWARQRSENGKGIVVTNTYDKFYPADSLLHISALPGSRWVINARFAARIGEGGGIAIRCLLLRAEDRACEGGKRKRKKKTGILRGNVRSWLRCIYMVRLVGYYILVALVKVVLVMMIMRRRGGGAPWVLWERRVTVRASKFPFPPSPFSRECGIIHARDD
ncbi:hypothetical protein HOY80DRAFT_215131 [Tuber brumale]|nr:hypothetical protein HOY80DRAFT_215131 [Tuber brumale]